jgi:hypothetical protein
VLIMATTAKGSFTVSSWEEDAFADLGGDSKLTRAIMGFAFTGDLETEGPCDALMYYRPDGTAVFNGFQRMTGTVAGKSGSFVLRADGDFSGGVATTVWEIVPGSATGDLAGLAGRGQAVSDSPPGGSYTLDYELS